MVSTNGRRMLGKGPRRLPYDISKLVLGPGKGGTSNAHSRPPSRRREGGGGSVVAGHSLHLRGEYMDMERFTRRFTGIPYTSRRRRGCTARLYGSRCTAGTMRGRFPLGHTLSKDRSRRPRQPKQFRSRPRRVCSRCPLGPCAPGADVRSSSLPRPACFHAGSSAGVCGPVRGVDASVVVLCRLILWVPRRGTRLTGKCAG